MNEFNDGGKVVVILAAVAGRSRREQNKRWSHPLAAAGDNVFGDLTHQENFGVQARSNHRVDAAHVSFNQRIELGQCHSG
jgi:hypothetical protein